MIDNITTPILAEDVLHPNDLDILCGSGKSVSDHPGNKRFRAIVAKHYDEYRSTTTKKEKMIVTQKVMEEILCSCSSQARFLKKDPIFEKFYIAKKRVGRDKISHCLRELKIERGRCARMKRECATFGQIPQLCHHTPNKNEMTDMLPLGVTSSPILGTPDSKKASIQLCAPDNAFGYGAYTLMKSMDANQHRPSTATRLAYPMLKLQHTLHQVNPRLQVTSQCKYQDQVMTPLERWLCCRDSENDLDLLLQSGAHHHVGISEVVSATVQTGHAEGQDYASAFPAVSTNVQPPLYNQQLLQLENDDITIPRFGNITGLFHNSPVVDSTYDLQDKAVSFQQEHGAPCAVPVAPLQISPAQQGEQNKCIAGPPSQHAGEVVKLELWMKKNRVITIAEV